jgi:hypothetical protein
MKRLLFLILLISFTSTIYGQTFLNGSFEINSTTNCMINNITNAQFNSIMTNVKGIGARETIDIYYDTDCPSYGAAQSGNYFVSVENNSSDLTKSTAISLKLSNSLQIGNSYNFCFYDKGLVFGAGPIVLGLSNTDSTFGSVIYTSPTIDTVWTMRTVSFIAPSTGRYITVKYGSFNGGALVDNFGDCSRTGINNMNSTQLIFKIFPNPAVNQISIQTNVNKQFHFTIYNSLGQWLQSGISLSNLTTIPIENLSRGFYTIEILVDNKYERHSFIVDK